MLLKKQNLIERQNFGEGEIFYVLTEKGTTVLKVINPMIREAKKLEALQF